MKANATNFTRRTSYSLPGSLFLSLISSLAPVFAQGADPIVVMQTTKGPIAMQIFVEGVPNTSRNFLDLVQRGFYNGLTFHRIENWCIQGGDPNGNGSGMFVDPGTGQVRNIQLEINGRFGHNSPGVLAMARSNNPNSASCQFYITKAAMPQLNGQYAIFGHVVDGMNSVYAMGRGDRILSAQIVEGGGGGGGNSGGGGGGGGSRSSGSSAAANPFGASAPSHTTFRSSRSSSSQATPAASQSSQAPSIEQPKDSGF